MSFRIERGDRLVFSGDNGCGKSSMIKAILKKAGAVPVDDTIKGLKVCGNLSVTSGLVISYVNQDTSGLSGSLDSVQEAVVFL